jgi:CheY-like chemotaxis protein
MKRHLERLGYEVIENDSGVGVYMQIQQYKPVACFIDIIMDKKEGLETILEITKLPMRPKIISVSSNMDYLDFAISMGADAQLLKPISPEKLESTLKMLLDQT